MQMPGSRVHTAIAMAVNVDTHGRRSVQVSVDMPGSSREVWDAIATGPGLACWFFPTDFMAGADGRPQELVCHMGPCADVAARVTAWEPPHSMVAEGDGFDPGGPAVTTEWTVEQRAFYRILQAYMAHFRGQPCAMLEMSGTAPKDAPAWDALTGGLGLTAAVSGERRSAPTGAPPVAGTVERAGDLSELLLRLDEPAPGVAHLFAIPMEDGALLSGRLYLYGDHAAETKVRTGPLWRAWMEQRFPPAPG